MWKSLDDRTYNQIDHILINKRHSCCIQKLRIYRRVGADNDYYLLYPKFNLRLSGTWRMINRKTEIDTMYNCRKISEINIQYVGKLQQNLKSTNIEKKDDIKDRVHSVWR